MVAAAVVATLVVLGVALAVWRVSQPGPASVDDAVEQFDPGRGDSRGDGTGEVRPPEGVYEYAGKGPSASRSPRSASRTGRSSPAR